MAGFSCPHDTLSPRYCPAASFFADVFARTSARLHFANLPLTHLADGSRCKKNFPLSRNHMASNCDAATSSRKPQLVTTYDTSPISCSVTNYMCASKKIIQRTYNFSSIFAGIRRTAAQEVFAGKNRLYLAVMRPLYSADGFPDAGQRCHLSRN